MKSRTPLAGDIVRLSKSNSDRYPAFASEVTSDKNGFYLFKYLGRASFKVKVSAPSVHFARNGIKVNLPDFGRTMAPSSLLNMKGTKKVDSSKPSLNAY